MVFVTFDPTKRDRTFADSGLDFADAAEVSAGKALEFEDDRIDYGQTRVITVGHLRGRTSAFGKRP